MILACRDALQGTCGWVRFGGRKLSDDEAINTLTRGCSPTAVDLAAYAAAHPQPAWSLGTVPGEKAYDSDPYDVVAYHGGWVVADAAANSLLQVSPSGRIRLLARFPAVSEVAPAGVFGPSP
jgi:hypothetical protein